MGNTPGTSQRLGATPSRTQHPARPLAGRLRRGVGTQTLAPSTFHRGCASADTQKGPQMKTASDESHV